MKQRFPGGWRKCAEEAGIIGKSDDEKRDELVADLERSAIELALGDGSSRENNEKSGPTQEDWDAATVRGWNHDGKECRVVTRFGERQFVFQAYGGFIHEGDTAFKECPNLREKVGMGKMLGYVYMPAPGEEPLPNPLVVGKATTYRGTTAGWITQRRGRVVQIVKHCSLINVDGADVPLRPW